MQSPKRPNVDSQLAPLSVVQADVDAMQGAASNIGALHPAHNQLDKLGQLYQTPRKLSDRALERSDSESVAPLNRIRLSPR